MRFSRFSLKKSLLLLVSLCLVSIWALAYYATKPHTVSRRYVENDPLVSKTSCYNERHKLLKDHRVYRPSDTQAEARVLVFVDDSKSVLGQNISNLLEANRFSYKTETAAPGMKTLPALASKGHGLYSAIVFENLLVYTEMESWNRERLHQYCTQYGVGLLIFSTAAEDSLLYSQVTSLPLFVYSNLRLTDYKLNPDSEVLHMLRAGDVVSGDLGDDWTIFQSNNSNYQPVSLARINSKNSIHGFRQPMLSPVVLDQGGFDGIKKIFFGRGLNFWLHILLFLDSLSYLSHSSISKPLERYILVDIDDIFVGKSGIRMKLKDVEALLKTQRVLESQVAGFKFNLGFSGKFYRSGNEEENQGDDLLLKYASEFWWFPHMWNHAKPHLYTNETNLRQEMLKNKQFAKQNGIAMINSYAVAPHHSGVYPVHEPLYQAWKKVWDIQVTSTEEYPHLKPARKRRAFIHKNIMVLPRQTCGLFTHNLFFHDYPGGRQRLENSIRGGELFQTIVNNQISIFMTHLSNYGNDRLALYTFENVIGFLHCWTNILLKTLPPIELAHKYYELYPKEKDPLWQNPCSDKRHKEIWSSSKSCNRLPKFIVIGPQKTGTTALYSFLSMHPSVYSNRNSDDTFEELQFFSGGNYYKGVDWYMEYFAQPKLNSSALLFEKSANYFDSHLAPKRVHAMLPKAKLIAILINPAKRAYSWYQHQRSHKDPASLRYSFYEVVTANSSSPREVLSLQRRCLQPGMYSFHLDKWLTYFPSRQLLTIDGDMLKNDPVVVMNKVQKFIKATPYYNYKEHLKFSQKKGFYCQLLSNGQERCLGRGKGRNYPTMEPSVQTFLQQYYRSYNIELARLLSRTSQPFPQWLNEDLSKF